jgi:hypothetical protein
MAPPAPQHRVQRLVVELAGARRADAGALQAAALRQVQQHLLPLIDSACTRLGDAHAVQRIDRLEIDLAGWPAAAWSADTAASQALRQQFEATLVRVLGQALLSAPAVQTDAELVASCLHTGLLPWWADSADRGALQRALAALLAQPVQRGQSWLPPADAEAPALQRLVVALTDMQLAGLLAQLQAQPGTAGVPWSALLATIAQALGLAPATLRQAWWREALAAALQPGWPAAQAWAQALQRLPHRLALGAGTVATAWRRALDQVASQAAGATGAAGAACAAGAAGADQAALAPLWQATQQAWPGAARAPVDRPSVRPSAPSADAPGQARHAPSSAAADAAALPAADAALDRLAAWLSRRPAGDAAMAWLPWLQALRQRVPGGAAPGWAALVANGAPAAALAAALHDGLVAAPLPAGASQGQRPGAAVALASLLQAQAPARQPGPASQPAAGVVAPDALYPANAGLVLLWPFVQRFADRQGLLDGRQLRSPAAAARLAVLLQCVAAGDADPPEFQLPLNKLLCGLPLDAPILLDEPITSAEQDECSDLLAAVVQAAPVLRQMSAGSFRQAFLQRQGQLLSQDGHWLMRVERATHDVVMDRFPWSPSIVRLPWMPRLLQVQW